MKLFNIKGKDRKYFFVGLVLVVYAWMGGFGTQSFIGDIAGDVGLSKFSEPTLWLFTAGALLIILLIFTDTKK